MRDRSSFNLAFQHPDFRRYLASSFATNVGTQMLDVAVGWQIYATSHRAIDLGYAGLAQFLPAFGLSLVTGHVADRFDRAKIVAAANLVLTVCALALFALVSRGINAVVPIYFVLVVIGVARAFDGPATQALVPGLVPPEHFPNAATWSSMAWQVSTIVGPAIGGVLYGARHGSGFVYVASAALLLIASLFAFAIRAQAATTERNADDRGWGQILGGFRFVRSRPILLQSISLDLFAVLLGGATALLPIYAKDILHVGTWGLGLLRSAPAVGAAAIAIVLAARPLERNAGSIMLVCVAVFGIATVLFGFSKSFPLSLAALVVLGASDMVSVVVRSTVVQLRTPPEMRGRVSAVSAMFIATSSDLGSLESGVTAQWLGAVTACVLGGIGTLVVVAVYAFVFKTLRSVDALDEVP